MICKRLALLLLGACVAVGCDSADTNNQAENSEADSNTANNDPFAVRHPKYPDVKIDFKTKFGGGGSSPWDKYEDGYIFSQQGAQFSGGGQQANVRFIYDGTTDAGDKYQFEVSIDSGDPVTKEMTYNGQETEVDFGDGVRIIAKPRE